MRLPPSRNPAFLSRVGRDPVGRDDADQSLFDAEVTELFRRHQPGLLRYVRSMGADHSLAEEIVNDAFLVVHRQWASVRSMDDPRGYLFMVARRRWYKLCPERTKQLQELGSLLPPDPHTKDPSDGLIAEKTLLEHLMRLPPCYRQVLLLDEVYGFEIKEVAKILNLRPGTVKRYGHDARLRLCQLLAETERHS